MNPVWLALATQRLTQLVVDDELPRKYRDQIVEWGENHEEFSLPERLSYLVSCKACASIWAAAIILALSRFKAGRVLIRILAGSSVALTLDALVTAIPAEEKS